MKAYTFEEFMGPRLGKAVVEIMERKGEGSVSREDFFDQPELLAEYDAWSYMILNWPKDDKDFPPCFTPAHNDEVK